MLNLFDAVVTRYWKYIKILEVQIRQAAKPTPAAAHYRLQQLLASAKVENHGHRRVHFYRLAIENIRMVTPLLHRVHRRRLQQRMSAHYVKVLDASILANHRRQNHRALYVRGFG